MFAHWHFIAHRKFCLCPFLFEKVDTQHKLLRLPSHQDNLTTCYFGSKYVNEIRYPMLLSHLNGNVTDAVTKMGGIIYSSYKSLL